MGLTIRTYDRGDGPEPMLWLDIQINGVRVRHAVPVPTDRDARSAVVCAANGIVTFIIDACERAGVPLVDECD
jgi:hypothetical protein